MHVDDDRLVGASPCAHDPATALFVLRDGSYVPTPADLDRWRGALAAAGFRRLRTGALAPRQAAAAAAAGMVEVQELMLLAASCALRSAGVPVAPTSTARARPGRPQCVRMRRAVPRRMARLAAVDGAAFGAGWALTGEQLADVVHATPHARLWVATSRRRGGDVLGFVITGWGGGAGYVQRLAVHPDHHRLGIGAGLLDAAVRDLCRRDVTRVYVNTDVHNTAAIELYRRAGFVELPERLMVFEGPTAP